MAQNLLDLPNGYLMGIDLADPNTKDMTVFSIWHKSSGNWVVWEEGRVKPEGEFDEEVVRIALEYNISSIRLNEALRRWGISEERIQVIWNNYIKHQLDKL